MNCSEAEKFVPRPEKWFSSKYIDNRTVIADLTDRLLEADKMHFFTAEHQAVFIL